MPRSGLLGILSQQPALELDRGEIAERGMQAFLVVDLVQKPADAGAGLRQIAVFAAIDFLVLLQTEEAPYITRELALRWATQPAKVQPATWAERLGMVRRFALWHSTIDPRTEIPPVGLLPHRYRRKPPHIYSDEEIEKLLRQAQQLPSLKAAPAPIRPFSA